MAKLQWEDDGVGCGGHYFGDVNGSLYVGVHEVCDGVVQCSVWTPGCGFDPIISQHSSLAEAKQYGEERFRLLAPSKFAA